MTKLKPCPFCGGDAEMRRTSSWNYFVKCTNKACGASSRHFQDNEPGAALSWNRRAENAELRKLLVDFRDAMWGGGEWTEPFDERMRELGVEVDA